MCRFEPQLEVLEQSGPIGLLVCLTPSGYALPPELITGEVGDAAWACLVASLEEARRMDLPAPERIRVADPTIASVLEARLAETDIHVVVGPTPEVVALQNSFEAHMAQRDPPSSEVDLPSSFFDDDADITPELVRALCEQALQFRALRPWTYAAGQSMMRVDAPVFEVHDANLSIVSDEGMGGWMVSHVDEELDEESEGELPAIPDYLALGFVGVDDLTDALREELEGHELPIDEEGCVPFLFAGSAGMRRRPLDKGDYLLAIALLEVLVDFVPSHRNLFVSGFPRSAEAIYRAGPDDDPVSIAIAAAHASFFDEQDFHVHGEDDEPYPS